MGRTIYQHECGHRNAIPGSPLFPDETKHVPGLCLECRTARIGEVIDFVRYGSIPESGSSCNHRDRTSEGGVSVYEVRDGHPVYVGWYFGIIEREVVIRGRGRIVGWGSDGEPLVEIL